MAAICGILYRIDSAFRTSPIAIVVRPRAPFRLIVGCGGGAHYVSMCMFSIWHASWQRVLLVGSTVLVIMLVTSCSTTRNVGEPGLETPEGIASYYGAKYAGRPTANGEIFDPSALTAAHKTLPFGSRVRVTRLDRPDKPSVVVRINDRGPFKRGRIIDLTREAARRIDMIGDGLADVRLEVLSYPKDVDVTADTSSGAGW